MSSSSSNRTRRERDDNNDDVSGYAAAAGVVAGVAALAGGIYWLTSGRGQQEPPQKTKTKAVIAEKPVKKPAATPPSQRQEPLDVGTASVSGYLSDFINRMATPRSNNNGGGNDVHFQGGRSRRSSPPANPTITNLHGLLDDIYVRFIQIQDRDFRLHYAVFDEIFLHLHRKMQEVDPYYGSYSSTVQFAGSHFDNLRIKKPDEFDMDIIIDLPLNLREHPTNPSESDIVIEPKSAGFVQLRMGKQFQNLPMRDGNNWQTNKAAYKWMDNRNYLQRSEFFNWFKGVVDSALNKFPIEGTFPLHYVRGIPYSIRKSESGPAVTLIIENRSNGFRMDVDLVPALKFPEERWPIGPSYQRIPPGCNRGHWMVVGKPVKNGVPHDARRSWRLALHNQERGLLYDTGNLRQAIRLLKKLRDALGMKKIASYYIKTLFFWEIIKQGDKTFWQTNNPAFLFKLMVGRLHTALVNGRIPYFWNKGNNLIEHVGERVLFEYAAKLVPLMQVLESPKEYKQVAKYLLTSEEFLNYNMRFLHV